MFKVLASVFKMHTYYYNRTEMKSDETYTTYIVK